MRITKFIWGAAHAGRQARTGAQFECPGTTGKKDAIFVRTISSRMAAYNIEFGRTRSLSELFQTGSKALVYSDTNSNGSTWFDDFSGSTAASSIQRVAGWRLQGGKGETNPPHTGTTIIIITTGAAGIKPSNRHA